MKRSGDDGREMPHGPGFDDGAIDAILGGNPPSDDLAALSSFVGDVRSAAGTVPTPSSALAAALASGISPQATTTAPEPKWRKLKMKIQGFLAGLGVAGKLALGAGVAAAATTGAGAAGVLPGPVQHAFANAVHAVTPFEVPDGNGGDHVAGPPPGDETTTTLASTPSTEPRDGGDGTGANSGSGDGDGNGVVVTPTTEQHAGDGTGASNPPSDGTGSDGSGDHQGDTAPPTETPTTEHHGGSGDGDNNNPESLSLNCERGREPNRISCNWSASSGADHHRYLLLRIGDGQSRVVFSTEDGLSFTDTNVQPGVTYGYRVISVRIDDSVEAHSPMVYVQCCGDTPPTTAPSGGGDGGGESH